MPIKMTVRHFSFQRYEEWGISSNLTQFLIPYLPGKVPLYYILSISNAPFGSIKALLTINTTELPFFIASVLTDLSDSHIN